MPTPKKTGSISEMLYEPSQSTASLGGGMRKSSILALKPKQVQVTGIISVIKDIVGAVMRGGGDEKYFLFIHQDFSNEDSSEMLLLALNTKQ